jgi:hypothetical protein
MLIRRTMAVLSTLTWAWALLAMAGCKLGPGKSRCATDGDCLTGKCVETYCTTVVPDAGAEARAMWIGCNSATNPCLPSASGAPMSCFPATSLAGSDFCAETCQPGDTLADASQFECVPSGAAGVLLQRCHPTAGGSPAADCLGGLNCYRTSVLTNTGLCIAMPVCQHDSDCPTPTHARCASSLVAGLSVYAQVGLSLDHLNCVDPACLSTQSSCPTGEGCLGTQYATIADLCVPYCDSNLNCPPNYSCVRATSGAGSAQLCIPGLPGTRCNGDQCLLGSCQDTGAGFSVCATDCTSDLGCANLTTSTDAFVCADGGGQEHCVTPRPFDGANCDAGADCIAARGEICATVDRQGLDSMRGECRVPCSDAGTCDPQGGLPHGCLRGSCYPGVLGIPCAGSSECIEPLSCLPVKAESDLAPLSTQLCSLPCGVDGGTDADADSQCQRPEINGYCANGTCRLVRSGNQPCTRNAQCGTGPCDTLTLRCPPGSAN